MGTELRNRNKRYVEFVELVTSTCLTWQVTKVEAISCLGLHGAVISATHSDTIGSILVVCVMVVCWDEVVGSATIQGSILGTIALVVVGVLGDSLTWIPFKEGIADYIGCMPRRYTTLGRSDYKRSKVDLFWYIIRWSQKQ